MWAASRDDICVMNALLRWNAELHCRDRRDFTALHCATYGDSFGAAKTLLQAGCDPNLRDRWGRTPLMVYVHTSHATQRGQKLQRRRHSRMLALLLRYRTDVNCRSVKTFTALHYAACNPTCPPSAAHRLVQSGADLDSRDKSGNTPLLHAIRSGNTGAVAILVRMGSILSVVNNENAGVLHYAAAYGSVDIMRLLMAANIRGVDVRSRDLHGRTPEDYFSALRPQTFSPRTITSEEAQTFRDLTASAIPEHLSSAPDEEDVFYECVEVQN